IQAAVGGQNRIWIGAAEMERPVIACRGVVKLIQGRRREIKGAAQAGARRGTETEVSRAARADRNRAAGSRYRARQGVRCCNRLTPRRLEGRAKGPHAIRQAAITWQHALAIAACKMDGPPISGRGVIELVDGRHGEVKDRPGRCGCRRAHIEVGCTAGAYRNRAARARYGAGYAIARRDRLTTSSPERRAKGTGAIG